MISIGLHWLFSRRACLRTSFVLSAVLISNFLLPGRCEDENADTFVTSRPPYLNISSYYYDVASGESFTVVCMGDAPVLWQFEPFSDNNARVKIWSSVDPQTDHNAAYASILKLDNAGYNDTRLFVCGYAVSSSQTNLQTLFDDPGLTARIYLFVNDPEHFHVVTSVPPMMGPPYNLFLALKQGIPTIIPCRPTSSRIDTKLFKMINNGEEVELGDDITFDPTVGFTIKYVNNYYSNDFQCRFTLEKVTKSIQVVIFYQPNYGYVPPPEIQGIDTEHIVVGSKFQLVCKARVQNNVIINVSWNKNATDDGRVSITPPRRNVIDKDDYSYTEVNTSLIVQSAELSDRSVYRCKVLDHANNENHVDMSIHVYETSTPFIQLRTAVSKIEVPENQEVVTFAVDITAWPQPEFLWTKGDVVLPSYGRYEMFNTSSKAVLHIYQLAVTDAGIYTLTGNLPSVTEQIDIHLHVNTVPSPEIPDLASIYYAPDAVHEIHCEATGNPIPEIRWMFQSCQGDFCQTDPDKWMDVISKLHSRENLENVTSIVESEKVSSTLQVYSTRSGTYKCQAANKMGSKSVEKRFLLSDVDDGFGVLKNVQEGYNLLTSPAKFIENERVLLVCRANKYGYNMPYWKFEDNILTNETKKGVIIGESLTELSSEATLILSSANVKDSGSYSCAAELTGALPNETTSDQHPFQMIIQEIVAPIFEAKLTGVSITKNTEESHKMTCQATGFPSPIFTWFKDDKVLVSDSVLGVTIMNVTRGQTIVIERVVKADEGVYVCEAANLGGVIRSNETLVVVAPPVTAGVSAGVVIAIVLAVICASVVILFVIWKAYFKKQLKKWEAIVIKETDPEEQREGEINPDLPINDQAELLGFDPRYEFPKERVKFGKKIGQGAFGCVMLADCVGIIENETQTKVAVKMLKERVLVDINQRKALLSEIKILIHIGRHLNIVNLLGTVMKNGELLLIMEYCKYGSLREFLRKNRSNFVYEPTGFDDDDDDTDVFNGRRQSVAIDGYGGSQRTGGDATQTTTLTGTFSSGDGRGLRGASIHKQKPIEQSDLLSFAYQVARGMEFLASQKCIHRDLAARNVLLTEDNIVKVCDFGLAKDMEKYPDYVKQSAGPMPVKWMPLESVLDKVFSTKSDVWSYGILLWEMFTLGSSPYPGLEINNEFIQRLQNGYRMSKPIYARKEVYAVMQDCWKKNPEDRPTFAQLVERIGSMMEGDVRQHYMDLNTSYLELLNEGFEQRATSQGITACNPTYINLPDNQGYVNVPLPQHSELSTEANVKEPEQAKDVENPIYPGYDNVKPLKRPVEPAPSIPAPRPVETRTEEPKQKRENPFLSRSPDVLRSISPSRGGARESTSSETQLLGERTSTVSDKPLSNPNRKGRGPSESDNSVISGLWADNSFAPPSYNVVMGSSPPVELAADRV